jgi:hypothetical protein
MEWTSVKDLNNLCISKIIQFEVVLRINQTNTYEAGGEHSTLGAQ